MSSVISGIFGGKPQAPKPTMPAREISQTPAQNERDRILKLYANNKMRRATTISELSRANVRHRTLGVG